MTVAPIVLQEESDPSARPQPRRWIMLKALFVMVVLSNELVARLFRRFYRPRTLHPRAVHVTHA